MCGRNPGSDRVEFVNAKKMIRQDEQDKQDGRNIDEASRIASANLLRPEVVFGND
jgi:hypothetical protein